jgi:hypothetical protein
VARHLYKPGFDILNHLNEVPSGTVAFHAMLGVKYPTDIAKLEELKAANRPPSDIVKHYVPFVAVLTSRGVGVERLILGPGPEDSGYEAFWALKRLILKQVVEVGEDIRITELSLHFEQLERMQATSRLARAHLDGLRTGVPQSSFWTVARPDEPEITWIMNYRKNPQTGQTAFAGGPVYCDYNREDPGDDVGQWQAYWRDVYLSDGLSRPLLDEVR